MKRCPRFRRTALRLIAVTALFASSALLTAQTVTRDVLGDHDLSPVSGSTVTGAMTGACLYCHAPHSGMNGRNGIQTHGLWNQKLSTATYQLYTSSTYTQQGTQPALGGSSNMCLSCHDGTVAAGETIAYGTVHMNASMDSLVGTDLRTSHPISLVLPIKDAAGLNATFGTTGQPVDSTGGVKLVNGNIECTTCHNPHVQNIDPNSPNFLVRDNSNSEICLSCHDLNRTDISSTSTSSTTARMRATARNTSSAVLTGRWSISAHAMATNRVSLVESVATHPTVGQNGCLSCHTPHNAVTTGWLLRDNTATTSTALALKSMSAGRDARAATLATTGGSERTCLGCHDGSSRVTPKPADVLTEFSKTGHTFPTSTQAHTVHEPALMNQNRHATCVDCHNPHAAEKATATSTATLRPSQLGVVGVSATDGTTVVKEAQHQYENCLRCHGSSTGKVADSRFGYMPLRVLSAGDPLDVRVQLVASASSSHPVLHERNSGYAQQSLRTYMMKLDGRTPGRTLGSQILCSDCHNSDDNRESGGNAPNGPHGSKYTHILERRYEMSQTAARGERITNLFPSPELGGTGPYALCAKCHDLSRVVANTSFSEHSRHINAGFSCSVCHAAHGVGAQSAGISGQRLVNFDANVVAGAANEEISYDRQTNSCSLYCHGHVHHLKTSSAQATTAR